MQLKSIYQEIGQLPLDKKFQIIEYTLNSIKNDEKKAKNKKTVIDLDLKINEKSLSKEWLSDEDNRWDNIF